MKLMITLLIFIQIIAAEKVIPKIENGSPAPIFMLPSSTGNRISIRDYCGKLRNPWKNKNKHYVVLSFMASYCLPCRKEIPQLEEFAKEAKDDIKVLFISIDSLGQKVMDPFIKKMNITQTVLIDKYGQVMKKYGVKKLPSLFIIDKDGIVRFQSLNGLPEGLDLKAALLKKISFLRQSQKLKQSDLNEDNKIKIVKMLLSGETDDQILKELDISMDDLGKVKTEVISIIKTEWGIE